MTVIAVAIFAVFALGAGAMFTRRLPALLALPAMAIAITLLEIAAGRLALTDLTDVVIGKGATRLAEPGVVILLGGVLSALLQRTGVAQDLVRCGAEYAGEKPLLVVLVLMGSTALLFTTITGLGALILVGTVVLPILAALGVGEALAGGILLFGTCIGGLLNAANWSVYESVLGLERGDVLRFAPLLAASTTLVAIVFAAVELHRARMLRLSPRALWKPTGVLILLAAAGWALGQLTAMVLPALRWSLALGLPALALATPCMRWRWPAFLTPLVPLALIAVCGIGEVAAFLAGVGYASVTTWRQGGSQLLVRAFLDGGTAVMPALVLLLGLGMLLVALLGPAGAQGTWPVLADMQPAFARLVPGSRLGYVLLFTLLAPLALYRGPLNVWGLGYPLAGALLAAGMRPEAIMGMLLSVGILQGVSDPTNTANVWVANEMRIDVQTLLRKTLLWTWVAAGLGLVLAP